MYREDIEMLWVWILFIIPGYFLALPFFDFTFGSMVLNHSGVYEFLEMFVTFHFVEASIFFIDFFANYYLWLLDAIIFNLWIVQVYVIIVLATIIYFLITAKKKEESSSSNV